MFFSGGIVILKSFFNHPKNLEFLVEKFIEFISLCKSTEKKTLNFLKSLKSLIEEFGLPIFDDFFIPIAKSQTVATFMILESVHDIHKAGGIKTNDDLKLIKFISKTYLTKANVILKDILINGLRKGIISIPINKDAVVIKGFLENTPAYLLDLYIAFKEIYTTSNDNERDEKILLLFKDVRQMKKEIFEGSLSKSYDQKMLLSILYFVFACHDITVPKENYERTWFEREDRSNDIPLEFSKPLRITLSKGDFVLKNADKKVDSEAWNLIIEAAKQITSKKSFNLSDFGFQMVDHLISNTLKSNRKYFIFQIYQHSLNNGENLPVFRQDHQTLMKYKEFIGDRMANDLIFSILKESIKNNHDLFYEKQLVALNKKKVSFKGLSKQIFGVLNSNQNDEKKDEIINKILNSNGFETENISFLKNMSSTEIDVWLSKMKPSIIEKGLIAKIFGEVYGDDYSKMQEEMNKYEFKKEKNIGGGKKYTLLISKKKTHCLAMYNMGVCVAPDNELWNKKDFWQLIIFDEDRDAHGGAILRFVEDNNHKWLVLSIQPASSILSQVSPVQIFNNIVQVGKIIARKTGCSGVLIPKASLIHSNRGSIQAVIAKKYHKVDVTLNYRHQFSYNPYSYSYKEFYKA